MVERAFKGWKALPEKRIFEIESTKEVPVNLSKPFKKALKECGLLYDQRGDKRTLYSLRHSF